jgi:hypothetical protein
MIAGHVRHHAHSFARPARAAGPAAGAAPRLAAVARPGLGLCRAPGTAPRGVRTGRPGRTDRGAARPVGLVAADQPAVRARSAAVPRSGRAGMGAAERIRAALAAQLERLRRAGAALPDRLADRAPVARAAGGVADGFSPHRSGQWAGRYPGAAGAGISGGALRRGGNRAADLRPVLAALPAAAQLPGPPAQPVARRPRRIRCRLLFPVTGTHGGAVGKGAGGNAPRCDADQQQFRSARRGTGRGAVDRRLARFTFADLVPGRPAT